MNKWVASGLHAFIVGAAFVAASGSIHGTALLLVNASLAAVSTLTAGAVVYHAPPPVRPNGGGTNGTANGG